MKTASERSGLKETDFSFCFPGVFSRRVRYCIPLLLLVGIIAVMVWAKGSGPFKRIELSLKTADGGAVNCLVVLPKPVGKHPVVIYLQGVGGSLLGSGNELRQFAELGLAAVGLEYDQTNQSVFDGQFTALYQISSSSPGRRATPRRGLGLVWERNDSQFCGAASRIAATIAGATRRGGGQELDEQFDVQSSQAKHSTLNTKYQTSNGSGQLTLPDAPKPFAAGKSQLTNWIHCSVLLVHGEQDEVFPVADVRRLAEWLRSQGVVVEAHILPGLSHGFGEDREVVMRAVAEYCAARLALPDYTDHLIGCQLNLSRSGTFESGDAASGATAA